MLFDLIDIFWEDYQEHKKNKMTEEELMQAAKELQRKRSKGKLKEMLHYYYFTRKGTTAEGCFFFGKLWFEEMDRLKENKHCYEYIARLLERADEEGIKEAEELLDKVYRIQGIPGGLEEKRARVEAEKKAAEEEEKAEAEHKKRLEEGDPEALYQEGKKCDEQKNGSAAADWYRAAADKGHPQAAICYMEKCLRRIESKQEELDILTYYLIGARAGLDSRQISGETLFRLAERHFQHGSEESLFLRTRAAEKGWAKAMVSLGLDYKSGNHVERDPKAAAEWFRKAAEAGSASGMQLLGDAYFAGDGVEKNEEEGFKWLREAFRHSDRDETHILYRVGECYERGMGVEKNMEKALDFYEGGDSRGERFCSCRLAELYYEGKVVPKDMKKALYYMERSPYMGENAYRLTLCYLNGEGTEKNFDKAREWARKMILQKGWGVSQAHKANKWWADEMYQRYLNTDDKAEEAFWQKAILEEGCSFFDEERFSLSVPYLENAAEIGYVDAFWRLAALYAHGTEDGMEKDPARAAFCFKRWLGAVKPGSKLRLGHPNHLLNLEYPEYSAEGKTLWRVLEVKGDHALLLSEYGLSFEKRTQDYEGLFNDTERELVASKLFDLSVEDTERFFIEGEMYGGAVADMQALIDFAEEHGMDPHYDGGRTGGSEGWKYTIDWYDEKEKQKFANELNEKYHYWRLRGGSLLAWYKKEIRPINYDDFVMTRPAVWFGLGEMREDE